MAKISIDRVLLKARSHARKGQIEEAKRLYQSVLMAFPNNVRAQKGFAGLGDLTQTVTNQLIALYNQGQLSDVVEQSKALLEKYPDAFIVWNLLGAAKKGLGQMDEAVAAYNKALLLKPDYALAYNNIGVILREQGKLDEAIEAYNSALSVKPDFAEAYNNMGVTLQEQGKFDDSIVVFNRALSVKPNFAEAHSNMGVTLQRQGKLDEAIAAYDKAVAIKPDYAFARSQRLLQLAHMCDWSAIEADSSFVAELGIIGASVVPFTALPLEDAPERHRSRSEHYAREIFGQRSLLTIAKPSRRPERLRIGYFSADFYNHATMCLMAQIFAVHDKSNFEIFAFSYGPDTQDKMRKKLISDVDVFHDVREMSDMQIVELARTENLSIAIDLKGFTAATRLEPFSYGLAPVQISYLGYPGTLCTDFIDYIVADPVLIPDNKRQYYSEKIIYLPNTYQPTDNTRIISDKVITREDMGLPNYGFVFCCFNNNYKINRKEFDIWMRLLGKVEDSVLWLLKSNKWAEQNLKREAEARGISAERLIFAEKVPQDEHLARQKLADLFLDTFNYNAHTTTSDALWVGLPVVTKLGEGFAARVAASLLTAIGLPELITESEEAYEALALALAKDPNELAKIKLKLEANRLTQPLFDSETYTRHLETGYQMAYDRYFTGHSPAHIILD